MKLHWDLFCSVIDNYGDIGFVWRVARALAHSHGQMVRLWVDDLETFHRIWPEVKTNLPIQNCEGVEIHFWGEPSHPLDPGDVVVEAFACRVHEDFLQAMAARDPKPVWVNLEYFSAEDWVPGSHGLSSRHPRLPLTQYFFVPGILAGTGGVPGERSEMEELDQFRSDKASQSQFWQGMCPELPPGRIMSLFSYENQAVAGLIGALAQYGEKTNLLVPEGKPLGMVAAALGKDAIRVGERHSLGNLTISVLPFMPQPAYDKLLWSCGINIVRGEDSFIRAQHAARPLVWQAYVQEEGAHWPKIEAFLGYYTQGLGKPAEMALRNLWRDWNAGEKNAQVWVEWLAHLPEFERHARLWAEKLRNGPELVEELVKFVLEKQPHSRV